MGYRGAALLPFRGRTAFDNEVVLTDDHAFGNEVARMISLAFDNEIVLTDDGGHR